MKQKSYGGLLVIFLVCILAFGLGAVFGIAHVGEDFSKQLVPTSFTRSSDIVQVIDEKSFEPENITIKFQTQTKVKQTKNYTYNNTNNSDNGNSSKNSNNSRRSSNYNRSNHSR